jgi:hypothetical protein
VAPRQQASKRSRELWEALLRVTPPPSERQSARELRGLAARGQSANAVILAFVRDLAAPLAAQEFEAHLEGYCQKGSRDLARNGYRLRLAERDVIGKRRLVPLGPIESVLRSSKSAQEKTTEIAEYLDNHEAVGLGDPVRLYVLASFDEICRAFDDLSRIAIDANRQYISDPDMQSELYRRFMAYGYVYRVAEELVLHGLPANWESDDTGPATSEHGEACSEMTPLWAYFHGKDNTAPVLFEKAKVVASLIDSVWSDGLVLSAPIRTQDISSKGRLEDDQARRVIAENAALFLRIVDEIAFTAMGADLSDGFIDALMEFVAKDALGRGVDPETFARCLDERLAEYAGYRKWLPAKGESARGTLFWEFGKRIADIIGIGRDAVFNLLLTHTIMNTLAMWQLHELLKGIEARGLSSSP